MSLRAETENDKLEATPLIGGPVPKAARPPEPEIFEDPITDEEQAQLEAKAAKFRETAFTNCDCHAWRGKPLYGFSSSREMLWLELRSAVGAPPLSTVFSGDVRGILPDAARILFTCFFPGDDRQRHETKADRSIATLTEFRRAAAGDMFEMQARVDRWADEYIIGDEESEMAVSLALLIFREARANCPEVTPQTGGRSGGQAVKESPPR